MAAKTAPSFVDILAVVNAGSREQVVSALSRYKPTGEIKRYLALPDNAGEVVGTPVRALTIDEVDCLGNNNP